MSFATCSSTLKKWLEIRWFIKLCRRKETNLKWGIINEKSLSIYFGISWSIPIYKFCTGNVSLSPPLRIICIATPLFQIHNKAQHFLSVFITSFSLQVKRDVNSYINFSTLNCNIIIVQMLHLFLKLKVLCTGLNQRTLRYNRFCRNLTWEPMLDRS